MIVANILLYRILTSIYFYLGLIYIMPGMKNFFSHLLWPQIKHKSKNR